MQLGPNPHFAPVMNQTLVVVLSYSRGRAGGPVGGRWGTVRARRCSWFPLWHLAGAVLALVIAIVTGVTTGLVAGYYAGWFDSVSWLAGLLMALPGMVLLLVAGSVLGPSLWISIAIFGVLLSPALCRLVFGAVTAIRSELYVDAARVAGLSDFRIIGQHI